MAKWVLSVAADGLVHLLDVLDRLKGRMLAQQRNLEEQVSITVISECQPPLDI